MDFGEKMGCNFKNAAKGIASFSRLEDQHQETLVKQVSAAAVIGQLSPLVWRSGKMLLQPAAAGTVFVGVASRVCVPYGLSQLPW